MSTIYTRRDCLKLATAAFAGLRPLTAAAQTAAGSRKPMRGAFMILTTPFTESGAVDWEDLVREVEFCDRGGVHGLVWPQGSSGVAHLTKEERLRGMEVLAKAARGKKAALVLGVQGRDTSEMLEYARHAEALAPDAMIAMPPSGAKSLDEYGSYFRALAKATARPVILQTTGGAPNLTPPVDLIVGLAREFPNLGYVKEESKPLVERMKAEMAQRPAMNAVFSATYATNWLYEMRLGIDGVITGMAMYADLMARLWDLHERRQSAELRDAFSRFLLMRNLNDSIPGTDLYVMQKRGIFKTVVTRGDGGHRKLTFSPDEIAEIEYRFEGLKPYLSGPSRMSDVASRRRR